MSLGPLFHVFSYVFHFLCILFSYIFLVISRIRVNHIPLSPSWSYLEVAEFQTEPEFPGGTLPSSNKAAEAWGSQESWSRDTGGQQPAVEV